MHIVRIIDSPKIYRVGKIICIARNYRDHVQELRNELPDEPVFFLKPTTSIIRQGEPAVIPSYSRLCHHEVELAVLIGKWGKNITEEAALKHVAGYGVAIDLTLRDVQERLKAKGLPWDKAKGFDTSCPLSDFTQTNLVSDPHKLQISLKVNGESRQNGFTGDMIHKIPTIISEASNIFTLEEGDILLTGSPAGVGPVVSGDRLAAQIERVGRLEIEIH